MCIAGALESTGARQMSIAVTVCETQRIAEMSSPITTMKDEHAVVARLHCSCDDCGICRVGGRSNGRTCVVIYWRPSNANCCPCV